MKHNVKAVPAGYHTATPALVIADVARAIDFYKKALNAKELMCMDMPGGMTHAEIKIGDSIIMLNNTHQDHAGHAENCPSTPKELKGTTSSLYLYVEDADATYKRAVAAGATGTMPVTEMFWGDRMGNITDPFGYIWTIATHVKNPTPTEMEEGAKEFAKSGN